MEKACFSERHFGKLIHFSAKIYIRIQDFGEKSLSLHHIFLNHKLTTL